MNLNTVGIPFQGGEDDTVILYCHKDVPTSEGAISQVYGISMSVSSLFLVITLIVFALLWEKHKHNIQRWTVFCYVLTLLCMYFFFILSYFSPYFDQETLTNGGLCRGIGIGMHFFFLATFCWLTTLNFEIWWTVRAVHTTVRNIAGFKRLIAYGVFAFGVPTISVGVGLILAAIYDGDLDNEVIIPEYGRFTCNIGSRDAFWAYMYGPVGFLLLSNLIFFTRTVCQLWRLQQRAAAESNPPTKHQKKQADLTRLFAKLYLIMGIPWIFEVISFAVQEDQFKWYWLIFDMINIFQSIAIFLIFVCNRETVQELETKFPCLKPICCLSHMGKKRG
jgi:G protein-coupled receptor Mth (Methuselah protein)